LPFNALDTDLNLTPYFLKISFEACFLNVSIIFGSIISINLFKYFLLGSMCLALIEPLFLVLMVSELLIGPYIYRLSSTLKSNR